MKRILFSVFGCISLFVLHVQAIAQDITARDIIGLRDATTGEIRQIRANVIDWDARRVVYDSNGREREIPSRRVVDIQYARSPAQVDADVHFDAGKLTQAMQTYDNAIQSEQRPWVKRNLRARRLRCAEGLGDIRIASAEFLEIVRSAEQTRHFHLIPLAWTKQKTPADLAQNLRQWLDGSDEVRKLIAASWLLGSDTERAEQQLSQLKRSGRSEIAHLATAQLWRNQTISVDTAGLKRWYAAIARMPIQLQAGPIFLVASAETRIAAAAGGDIDLPIAMMMRIPLLYPEHYQLAGNALLECNKSLERAGRNVEAQIISQQLQRDFQFSAAASVAKQNFETIDN